MTKSLLVIVMPLVKSPHGNGLDYSTAPQALLCVETVLLFSSIVLSHPSHPTQHPPTHSPLRRKN